MPVHMAMHMRTHMHLYMYMPMRALAIIFALISAGCMGRQSEKSALALNAGLYDAIQYELDEDSLELYLLNTSVFVINCL